MNKNHSLTYFDNEFTAFSAVKKGHSGFLSVVRSVPLLGTRFKDGVPSLPRNASVQNIRVCWVLYEPFYTQKAKV